MHNSLQGYPVRDEYVRKVPAGEQIIEEYYRIAPHIVANINSRRNSKRIYHSLYRRLVQKSLGLLLLGKKQEALYNYLTIVEDSKRKYFFLEKLVLSAGHQSREVVRLIKPLRSC